MAALPKLSGEWLLSNNAAVKKLYDTMRSENKIDPLIDLTNKTHHKWGYDLAEILLKSPSFIVKNALKSLENLSELYDDCRGDGSRKAIERYPMAFHTGIQLARSKVTLQIVGETGTNVHCTVVFAMYKEGNRMKDDNEDFVHMKVRQLNWLFKDFPTHTWELIGIDDGCPMKPQSGDAMQAIINGELKKLGDAKDKLGWDRVKAIFLQSAIDDKLAAFADIKTTKDSRKGGSIQYGFYQVVDKLRNGRADPNKKDVLIYTDADLSSDLGLCGSVIGGLYLPQNAKKGIAFAYGDRYEKGIYDNGTIVGMFNPNYVVCSIRAFLRSKMLPAIANVLDTQCGFKAFSGEGLLSIFDDLKCRDGSFDMEIFLGLDRKYEKEGGADKVVTGIPIAWTESTQESTFWTYDPDLLRTDYTKKHFEMIKQILGINQQWYKDSKRCDQKWIKWIGDLKWESYFHICAVLFERYVADQSSVVMGKLDLSTDELDALLNVKTEQKIDETQMAKS